MPRFNPIRSLCSLAVVTALVLTTGCGGGDSASTDTGGDTAGGSAALPGDLFLTSAPEGAQPIIELKENASEGDEVVVHVVVGGKMDTHVAGRSSAAIIDAGLHNRCLSEDDHCQTPWDYCCADPDDITANLANLQVVDSDGRVLPVDLSEKLPPMAVLTVRGVVGPRPNDQVLTINATGIYIEEGTAQ